MAEMFLMPKLGMDMTEGSVVNWLKKEGETVKKGEPLAEIETDKSSVEVESPAEGIVLKIYVQAEETVACGTPIAAIGVAGEDVPTASSAPPGETPKNKTNKEERENVPEITVSISPEVRSYQAVSSVTAELTAGGRIRSSPRARRLAAKEGIDLARIKGSGSQGRILEADVRDFLQCGVSMHATEKKAVRVPQETVKPLSNVRKITARRMFQSLTTTAQTNHKIDVDCSKLQEFRTEVNKRYEADGVKISYMDILTAVCAKALISNPQANAYWGADGIRYHNYANIGIATDTPRGLVVPVIKDADILDLKEINAAGKGLIAKARDGKLAPDDMSGGTFTISNLGMLEIDSFTAVLNPPESCILAVGRISDRVVAADGQAVIRPMMNLCLTYDHQVIDGADAARFLQTIKHYLENPIWILLP